MLHVKNLDYQPIGVLILPVTGEQMRSIEPQNKSRPQAAQDPKQIGTISVC